MSELRWILIGFGIVLLASIYLWGRRGRDAGAGSDTPARAEPGLHVAGTHVVESPDEAVSAPDDSPSRAGRMSSSLSASSITSHAAAVDPYMATIARPALRREPTFSDLAPTEDLSYSPGVPASQLVGEDAAQTVHAPVRHGTSPEDSSSVASEAPVDTPAVDVPAVDVPSVSTHTPRRIERRKILSLRLSAAPQRLDGAKLLETLQQEGLEHGKYKVFHLLHDGASIFSVASMVEPGIFEPELMAETEFPGITLFAQLPGPVPGMHALNELVACARRLQQCLGGTLQDDRGVPLTVHRIERLRQEIREFERPASAGGRATSSS